MRHTLILTGGHLNIDFASAYIKTLSFDKVFAVDKGLEYADILRLTPDDVIGDFDTVNMGLLQMYEERIQNSALQTKIQRHPVQKDATDTALAIGAAIQDGTECITILGATGTRMDHVLSNIQMLNFIENKGVRGYIVDETNRIQLLSDDGVSNIQIKKSEQFGKYVSLIPVTENVEGVTVKGASYPLENATLYYGNSISVSNEIKEDIFSVELIKGKLLLIESMD